MSFLSMLGGRLRVAGCGGPLVAVDSTEDPCCCGKCGCTNPYAPNYDPEAELDDGSCYTCCNQGLCVVDDDDAGDNCNPLGGGASKQGHLGTCCDAFCLTAQDCSYSFDSSYEPEKFCPGTDEFTYHDCYSCPQSIKEANSQNPPAFLELQQILDSKNTEKPLNVAEIRRRAKTEDILRESATGPGKVLSKIFAVFGIRATRQCICTIRAHVMNVMGCRWCLTNIFKIAGWLEQEARRRKIPYAKFAGVCVVFCAVILSSALSLFSRKPLQYG